jgi:hypothetical protein
LTTDVVRDGTPGAWDVMMKGEKLGGHGERCVAVGTLDLAVWDAAVTSIRSTTRRDEPVRRSAQP